MNLTLVSYITQEQKKEILPHGVMNLTLVSYITQEQKKEILPHGVMVAHQILVLFD